MGKIWIVVSVVAIAVAAVCLILNYTDAAFVSAVLGCVAWFLSYRVKIKNDVPVEETDQ